MQQKILNFIARARSTLDALGYSDSGCSECLEFTTNAREAVKGSRFVQENAPEDLALKHALYREIAPTLDSDAILLSSTSGFTLSELQQGLSDPSRLVIAHPFNPPHLIPLVEVLGNDQTTPGLVAEVLGFYESLGKVPIELKKSVPGHVANRLQAVLWQEVLHLAKEGVASIPDIDKAIANGPGLRWAVYGPNQLFSLAAGDQGLQGFIQHLGPSFEGWWSSAGQVTFDEDTKRLIERQYIDPTGPETEEMKRRRDQLICQILSIKKAT
jgi:3-hydroxybutyryl-CoA dehydrogenase